MGGKWKAEYQNKRMNRKQQQINTRDSEQNGDLDRKI